MEEKKIEANMPTQKKKGLPPRLERSLKNADSNLKKIQEELSKFNLKNFDDTIALEMILKLLEANKTIQSERREQQRKKESRYNISTAYDVLTVKDVSSKNLISLIKLISMLNENNIADIQKKFLKNDINNLISSLNNNQLFIKDINDVITFLLKSTRNIKAQEGVYEEKDLIKNLSKLI
ncbi:hypothetical protein ACNSOL_11525 (plasmid) [Aliarcobacter lanthieri]|uniref:hypothetical protein n=1 Tax=Aliarcobacter lanthieri TaxID=1355374 RepID=UPI003AAE85F7